MVVWINNPFDFLPGEGARLQRYGLLARELVRAGHRVIWWSSDWQHLKKCKRSAPVEDAEGLHVEIQLIPTWPYTRNIGLRRFLSHWNYARQWLRISKRWAARHAEYRPDVILCSLPPLDTVCVLPQLKRQFGCRCIIDIMDAWPETFERVVPRWLLAPLRWRMARAYRAADGISAVGETYQRVVDTYLGKESKPRYVCYHGIDLVPEKPVEKGCGTTLRLLYIGNMSAAYDLGTVIRAVAEAHHAGCPVTLALAGDGPQRLELEQLTRTLKAENSIHFQDVLTGVSFENLLRSADVGLIPMFTQSWVAVPYKLADYAAYGIPVINCLSGETQSLIERYQAGWYYHATHVEGLRHVLCSLLKNREEINIAGRNIRRMAEECFDARVIYPRFVQWLEGEDS